MTQRKETRSRRRGSENRVRQKQVPVRLSPAEYEALLLAAKLEGKSPASLLRDAFLEQEQQRGSADA